MILILDEKTETKKVFYNQYIYLNRTKKPLQQNEICLHSFIEKHKHSIRKEVLELFYNISGFAKNKKRKSTLIDILQIYNSQHSFFFSTTLFYKCNWVISPVYNDLIKLIGLFKILKIKKTQTAYYSGSNNSVKLFFKNAIN